VTVTANFVAKIVLATQLVPCLQQVHNVSLAGSYYSSFMEPLLACTLVAVAKPHCYLCFVPHLQGCHSNARQLSAEQLKTFVHNIMQDPT